MSVGSETPEKFRVHIVALVLALMVLSVACDPPGKPKPNAENENREQITDFKTLFTSNCSGCHGLDGKYGPARILNDPLYLSLMPKETFKQVVTYGRPGTAMPAWAKSQGGPLTDKQVDALVNGLYREWGKSAQPVSGAPAYAATNDGNPTHGKQLFLRNCFMCHGKGAAVGPVNEPSYLSLVSDQMLRTSILIGRPDLGMPDYRHLNLGRALSDQDVTDLVAYLVSLRPAAVTAQLRTQPASGEQTGATGPHENENGVGEKDSNGPQNRARKQGIEASKSQGSSSQGGVK